jgi:cytochrome d ubiquinol oxidase subunit II
MTILQVAWFLLVGVLLAGYAILDGFDLGVGMLHFSIARNDRDRRILLNAIGPVWDGNEVWLLAAGGAIFAAFPRVYATVFSGFYIAMMLLLVALILRSVAIEFRGKVETAHWRTTCDVAFAVGSFLPALLLGVAIGNILRGVPLTADGEYGGTFIYLLNPFAIIVGLLSTAMFVMQGAAWLILKTDGKLQERARDAAARAWFAFAVLWMAATLFARIEAKYLFANVQSAATAIAPVVFVLAQTAFPFTIHGKATSRPFTVSSIAIATLIAVMGESLFPYLVPARNALATSLTIANASSSERTLAVMLTIALIGMPAVIGYTVWIYRQFAGGVTLGEHSY